MININVDNLISLGGGSKSNIWNQLKADITGKIIQIPKYEETTSLGAAMLAGVKCGYFKSVHEAAEKCVRIKMVYKPRDTEKYIEGYKKFIEITKKSL